MSDALAAVLAHGLLNSLAVVDGAALTLSRSWDRLAPEQRVELMQVVARHSALVADQCQDLPAVVSHKLANHLFVVRGVCDTLEREGHYLVADDRRHLFDVLVRQSGRVAALLDAVARGLPPEAQIVLDGLDSAREAASKASA
jgi:hypothetical protein